MSGPAWTPSSGAWLEGDGVHFQVWAPGHERVDVVLYGPDAETVHPLAAEADGFFSARVVGVGAGARYKYRLGGGDAYPDPASRSQPDGVHGPSEVVDPTSFHWSDGEWRGIPLEQMVIYELHVGTATEEGTFDALIGRLDHIVALGATAIEIMPVAEFPGARNWGYDGVFLFAPDSAYGGPEGLRRLVDAAHARDLAVVLDVVYNHFGPEGNYLPLFTNGKFFTERHHTPWGAAVNYDGEGSAAVREFVIGNALQWAHDFHVDGLRLDATHAILDDSPTHLLTELGNRVRESVGRDRDFVLVAEDEENDRKLITPAAEGGRGIDAVWADDFHHQLRRLVAGDHEAYFADYTGSAEDLAATLRKGWYYEGQASGNRGGPRGTPADGLPPQRFVHCIQNHDQVGNRAMGDRLNHNIDPAVFRAASALLLLTPYTPMLWMGQEWAATSPFLYFTDHPPELGKLVTEGRRKEFGKFSAFADPEVRESIPDPQSPDTFERSKLRWEECEQEPHAGILRLYTELLELRRSERALWQRRREGFRVVAVGADALALRRSSRDGEALLLVCAFGTPLAVPLSARPETHAPDGSRWTLVLATEEGRFGGASEGEVVRLRKDGVLELNGPGAVVLRAGATG